MPSRRTLLRKIDTEKVRAAIAAAERETTAELRVSLAPLFWGSVERAAHRAFDRLGMRATRERNGVLIFLVPGRRQFAVVGDQGIHARVGDAFWRDVAAAMQKHFRRGDFTAGLLDGIATIGEELRRHFPIAEGVERPNQLPDDVDLG